MCVSPLVGPSASNSSCRRRNCTHLSVSALEATSGCWTSLVWRSTPTTSSTWSASGKIHTPANTSTLWPMLQEASSTHPTKAWRKHGQGRTQKVGDQPAARQPHRVRRSRCVCHVQVMEHDRLHHRWFRICKRAGGWEILRPPLLPLYGMKIHQSLPSFYFCLCLPFILLFQISSLLLLGWTSMIMSCFSLLN